MSVKQLSSVKRQTREEKEGGFEPKTLCQFNDPERKTFPKKFILRKKLPQGLIRQTDRGAVMIRSALGQYWTRES